MIPSYLGEVTFTGLISGRKYRPFDSLANRVATVALSTLAALASFFLLPTLPGVLVGGCLLAFACAVNSIENSREQPYRQQPGHTLGRPPLVPTNTRGGTSSSSPTKRSSPPKHPQNGHVQVGQRDSNYQSPAYYVATSPPPKQQQNGHVQVGQRESRSYSIPHSSYFTNFIGKTQSGEEDTHVHLNSQEPQRSRSADYTARFMEMVRPGGSSHVEVGSRVTETPTHMEANRHNYFPNF